MLYQQGTQRIEVIVRKEGGASETGARTTPSENVGGRGGEGKRGGIWAKLTGSDNVSRQHRVIKTNATHALAITRQILFQGINYYLTGEGRRSGDQALQETYMREMEIAQDVTGFASSIAMGALYGSWGGPIGTVLGMTMAAATNATSIGIKYSERRREYNFKMLKLDNAIEYQRARANINLTTGRLR